MDLHKTVWILAALYFFSVPGVRGANLLEEGKAVVEKYIEDAAPLFDPSQAEIESEKKSDKFYDKIRKKRVEFLKEEQERKVKVLEKVRKKDLRSEKVQREIADFRADTVKRMTEFNKKQQEKIQKHIEKENDSNG